MIKSGISFIEKRTRLMVKIETLLAGVLEKYTSKGEMSKKCEKLEKNSKFY